MSVTLANLPMLADAFGGWEVVLILGTTLVLFGMKKIPELLGGLKRALRAFDQFREGTNDAAEIGKAAPDASPGSEKKSRSDEFVLWLAQGFDVGRVPFAPGTFGSLVGLLWFAILLVPGSLSLFLLGTFAGLVVSVYCCHRAERILQQTDPGSVVLDEIVALPICFLPWVLRECHSGQAWPAVDRFFSGMGLVRTAIIFVLFRVFDVLKPWPVRQSQRLPGGFGVTVDDVLAAAYVAIVVGIVR
jgi:phosphatidylglycerophosphatase A